MPRIETPRWLCMPCMPCMLYIMTGAIGCGADVPVPEPTARTPVRSEPSVPRSRLKFDVGMPESAPGVDPGVVAELGERRASAAAAGIPLRSLAAVQRFYEQRGGQPAWLEGRRISAVGVDALRGLARLPAHGLDPARYGTEALAPTGAEPIDPVGFELLLTDAWLTAAAHLRWGRVDPATRRTTWSADEHAEALVEALQAAVTEGDPQEALLAQAPSHAEYATRVALLEGVRARADAEGAPTELRRLRDELEADLERLRWPTSEPSSPPAPGDLGVITEGPSPTLRKGAWGRDAWLRAALAEGPEPVRRLSLRPPRAKVPPP
ncbi:MAG: hypothetical protein KDK70_27450 [Myxococcales bacterium]|nr:hypothetical protein [Myxococcales bacterium]